MERSEKITSAKVIAHTANKQYELITYELILPRIILSELNKHRLSTNSTSSSRAIPFSKLVKSIKETPFIPMAFQTHHRGMQGDLYIEEDEYCVKAWLDSLDTAISSATNLYENIGVTKQLCNRLLEPFMYVKMIFTTDKRGLENLFKQRCPDYEGYKSWKEYSRNKNVNPNASVLEKLKVNKGHAEIHFMDLAEKMYDAWKESVPHTSCIPSASLWHIPYSDKVKEVTKDTLLTQEESAKVSAAICANTSYTTIDGSNTKTLEDWLKLYDFLVDNYHMTPLEHCAVASTKESNTALLGPYEGFISLRYMIENHGN